MPLSEEGAHATLKILFLSTHSAIDCCKWGYLASVASACLHLNDIFGDVARGVVMIASVEKGKIHINDIDHTKVKRNWLPMWLRSNIHLNQYSVVLASYVSWKSVFALVNRVDQKYLFVVCLERITWLNSISSLATYTDIMRPTLSNICRLIE